MKKLFLLLCASAPLFCQLHTRDDLSQSRAKFALACREFGRSTKKACSEDLPAACAALRDKVKTVLCTRYCLDELKECWGSCAKETQDAVRQIPHCCVSCKTELGNCMKSVATCMTGGCCRATAKCARSSVRCAGSCAHHVSTGARTIAAGYLDACSETIKNCCTSHDDQKTGRPKDTKWPNLFKVLFPFCTAAGCACGGCWVLGAGAENAALCAAESSVCCIVCCQVCATKSPDGQGPCLNDDNFPTYAKLCSCCAGKRATSMSK